MKRIPRRIFTAEFKREAIKLVTEQGLTLAEASRKLDVATKSLRTWMDPQERDKLKPSLGGSNHARSAAHSRAGTRAGNREDGA